MSGMQPQMVGPLPVLRPDIGRDMAKPDSPLCSLQQTAETGNACGLGPARSLSRGEAQWIKTQNCNSQSSCSAAEIDEKHVRGKDVVAPDSQRTRESPRTEIPGGV